MSAFFTILFILLLVVLAVSLVKYFELPLPDSSSRKVLIGFTAAGTVLLVILLVVCSIIPGKTVSLVRNTLDSVEEQIEAGSPGYTTEVLDKSEFEAFIDGSLQTSGSIEGNQALSAVLDMSGLGPFKNVFEKFMLGIDDRLFHHAQAQAADIIKAICYGSSPESVSSQCPVHFRDVCLRYFYR